MNKFRVAFIAMASLIVQALTAKPVTINDNGNRYEVTGLDVTGEEPEFECRVLGDAGTTEAGGLKRLPVNDHYTRESARLVRHRSFFEALNLASELEAVERLAPGAFQASLADVDMRLVDVLRTIAPTVLEGGMGCSYRVATPVHRNPDGDGQQRSAELRTALSDTFAIRDGIWRSPPSARSAPQAREHGFGGDGRARRRSAPSTRQWGHFKSRPRR